MTDIVYHSSHFMLKIIDTILKTKIHVHAEELINKDAPTLFVANHFTRFETLVMPYVIHQYTDVPIRSLADKSLFIGLLGYYLNESGTLSTADKHRNEIIIGDLMTGRKNWIIYPEGNMIKNKRITHEKEFIIHTPKRKGGVYSGAAMLAMKSQLLKAEYRMAQKNGDIEHIRQIKKNYFLENMEEVNYHATTITPVTITYNPIRPGFNPMMQMSSLLAGDDISESVMEEIEIEGNILMNSEIHIRFGEPIDMAHYIDVAKKNILDKENIDHKILQLHRHRLTTIFMDSIYKDVLITVDHIFAAVLEHFPHKRISKQQLRQIIFLSAKEIVKLETYCTHPDLANKIILLLGDEIYTPFDSVLRLAQDQNILNEIHHEYYRINKDKLHEKHSFHTIRIKNTLLVILSEVSLLCAFHECIKHSVVKSDRQRAKEILFAIHMQDKEIFKHDYNKFYSVIDSKPKDIGSPFVLYNPEYVNGVVLIHGYKGAPAEMKALAEYLHERKFNIYGVRLQGHGTMPEDLRDTTHEAWYESFNRGYAAMRQVSEHLFVAGFSTGGLLALLGAARKLNHFDGIISINSALRLNDIRVHTMVPALNMLNDFLAIFNAHKDYVESEPENPHINYRKHYLSSIGELRKLMKLTDASLTSITVPTLIIQADNDPVINPESAELISNKISSEVKEVYMPRLSHHVIVTGEGSVKVFEKIDEFIEKCLEERPRKGV